MEPAIPHITEGYVSLRHVVNALVAKIYGELQNVLRQLPGVPNDAARKRAFLEFVVAARQEVVKLYVLCKWAVVAPDISRSIDVTSWLRGQHNCFINVVAALFHLQQDMGSAKLHHADVENALHVLKYGRTPNKTYGFVAPPPLGSPEILAVLRNLNVLLAIRLALSEKLPRHYRNYSIQNGRVRFKVSGSFWVDLGVADDAVTARFFYIDFGFDFSSRPLPPGLRARLETVANEWLAAQSLKDSLDRLLAFVSNYKLTLANRQLGKLERGLWFGVLDHGVNQATGRLHVRYWQSKPGSYELELAVSGAATQPLTARWLVDGRERALPPAVLGEFGATDLDVNALLSRLTAHHARLLVDELARPGIAPASDSAVVVAVGGARALRITVDHTSGKFSVQGDGLADSAQQALNELPDLRAVGGVIDKIRVRAQMDMIAKRAEAAGWVARPGIRLAADDMARFAATTLAVLALRMPSWPQGWYVAVGLGAGAGEAVWAAAQMRTTQRRWELETLHAIAVADEVDYALFGRLAAFCTSQFAQFDLCSQLDAAGVAHAPGRRKLQLVLDRRQLAPAAAWAHSALVLDWTPDAIAVRGCARAGRLAELGASQLDGLATSKTGEFTIELAGHHDLLARLRAQLARLDCIAAALRLARALKLDVLAASPAQLSLGYAAGRARLTVSGERLHRLEFASDNPQRMLAPFLPPLLARGGLGTVMRFLAQTYALFELLASARVIVLPRGATDLLVRGSLAPNDPEIELQVRYWRASPVVYVTANPAAAAKPAISELFARRVDPAATPLRQAVVIEMSGIPVIERLLKALA